MPPPSLLSGDSSVRQSVYRRAMGWTARVRFPAVQGFFLLHSVQTGYGAHPVPYPMGKPVEA
jgi:hypothetical protein